MSSAVPPLAVPDPELPGLTSEVAAAYRAAPAHQVAEVLDGNLSLQPRPAPRHAKVALRQARSLGGFYDPEDGEPSGWVILPEPELRLGKLPDILQPDLAGWRRERLPLEPEEASLKLAPDWVCEILSDSTEALDRGPKRRIYRREGVGHLWLCDPRIRTLEVYRLENGRWSEVDTFEGDVTVRAEPFDAIPLDLARWWRW